MSDATTPQPALPQEPSRSRRTGGVVIAVVAGALVLLLAGGGVAAWRLLSGGGSQPADVLPADTLDVVSLDLDPSGDQKIEAVRTLRKFPSFREQVGLKEDEDVAQALFEKVQEEDDVCPEIDYAEDVEPWLGQRFAVAAVPAGDEPDVVGVVQVTDPEAAREGIAALQACEESADEKTGGFAVGEDYAVVAETDDIAERVLADGEEDALSSDGAYQKWTEEAGGDGIVEMYASAGAAELLGRFSAEAGGSGSALDEQLEEFEGGAASLRLDDGVVLSFATSAGSAAGDASVSEQLETLPEDTAAVVGFGVSDETRDRVRELAEAGEPGSPEDDLLGQVEGAFGSLGLTFPDDLVTVLGDSLVVAVGGQAPSSPPSGPQDVPAGLRVQGDAGEIQDIVDRASRASGLSLEQQGVVTESDDDTVVMSFQQEYADTLLDGEGSLLDSDTFRSVVPGGEDVVAVFYLHLTDSWRQLLDDTVGDPELEENIAPFRAFGISGVLDGDIARGEARLSLN